jgi:hypothetical protein
MSELELSYHGPQATLSACLANGWDDDKCCSCCSHSICKFTIRQEDYHTSALSGAAWILELLEGHPNRIRCELGVNKHVFHFLISYLQLIGINHSRNITLEEQLAIFLYRCVTGGIS